MIRHVGWALAALVAAGCASNEPRELAVPEREAGAAASGPAYACRGQQLEGCECDVYCPCPFEKDATFDQCRALIVMKIEDGYHGETHLDDLTFALALTKSGKNVGEVAGSWEGLLFVPEDATDEQRQAITAIARDQFGGAFARLDVRTAPIEATIKEAKQSATIGGVARLEATPLVGANGKVTKLENPPSPLVQPVLYYARADVHTYDDGATTWDFSGHNAFFGPFEMRPKK